MPSAIQQRFESEISDLDTVQIPPSLAQDVQRRVGPFVWVDHLGLARFPSAQGVALKLHPYVNLATVTYLFEGRLIQAGCPSHAPSLHALQTWVALPDEHEAAEPMAQHYPVEQLPRWRNKRVSATLLAGQCSGYVSPVKTFSPLLYLNVQLRSGGHFEIPSDYSERAVYCMTPGIWMDGEPVDKGRLVVLKPGQLGQLQAQAHARCVVIGGEPMSRRIKWW